MRKSMTIILSTTLLLLGTLFSPLLSAQHAQSKEGLKMVTISVTGKNRLTKLKNMKLDITAVKKSGFAMNKNGERTQTYAVDAVVWPFEEAKLKKSGFTTSAVKAEQSLRSSSGQYTVYRSFDDPDNGVKVRMKETAKKYPQLTKLITIGYSIEKRPIFALRISRENDMDEKPKVLFLSTHHAREWVATEMALRLIDHLTTSYKTDKRIKRLLNRVEIWIVPVANPDGYEYTFTTERLWRKNLRDNDGDGKITRSDGVDLNRNFNSRWGLDNEGSSDLFASYTYRGSAPNSEPETKAVVRLIRKEKFQFVTSYHTYGNLILYPEGWQYKTKSLDDPIFLAQAGTDETPAIFDSLNNKGYDPGVGADLYITNGDFTEWCYGALKIPSYTVELTDGHDFRFPDDEKMLQTVFTDNLPFALSVAESAIKPFDPVSVVGTKTKALYHTPIESSYGPRQIVIASALKKNKTRLTYRINGGSLRRAKFKEKLGTRYNESSGAYYSRYQAIIKGQKSGDQITYSIRSGKKKLGPFTYTVSEVSDNPVLIIAAEDYSGTLPTYENNTAPNFLSYYEEALRSAGYGYDVWNVDEKRSAPSYTDVLSHYDAVIWYTGNDREPTVPGLLVHRDTYLNMRDYINFQNGKVFISGQDISYPSTRYGNDISDDFFQYYAGAYQADDTGGMDTSVSLPYAVVGKDKDPIFDGLIFDIHGLGGANNQQTPDNFLATAAFLPHFKSNLAASYDQDAGALIPYSGEYFVYSKQADVSFKRLGGQFTIPDIVNDPLELSFYISYDIEPDWDFAFVEVHDVETGQFTTLPDLNGATTQSVGDSCASGWVDNLHPFLAHYMDENCNPIGTTGDWHAITGKSAGWQEMRMDLSAYAGKTVEIFISYASDWGTQGLGIFIDDVTLTGYPLEDFETGLGSFTSSDAPSSATSNNWVRLSKDAFPSGPAIRTKNTLYLGFGFEAIESAEARTTLMERVMTYFNVE